MAIRSYAAALVEARRRWKHGHAEKRRYRQPDGTYAPRCLIGFLFPNSTTPLAFQVEGSGRTWAAAFRAADDKAQRLKDRGGAVR